MLDAHPDASGILCDVAEVIDNAAKDAFVAGRRDRICIVSGDFFREIPGGADFYLLNFMLHDWDDERAAGADFIGDA